MNNLLLKVYVNLQCLLSREDGQDLVEYALLVSLIALAAITGIKGIAVAINNTFSTVSNSLT